MEAACISNVIVERPGQCFDIAVPIGCDRDLRWIDIINSRLITTINRGSTDAFKATV